MAKGVNAADAHRKQLRAKEKKKNKQERVKARELGDVKKDTRCGCLCPCCCSLAGTVFKRHG
jgi:hypothetical protein